MLSTFVSGEGEPGSRTDESTGKFSKFTVEPMCSKYCWTLLKLLGSMSGTSQLALRFFHLLRWIRIVPLNDFCPLVSQFKDWDKCPKVYSFKYKSQTIH